MITPRFEPISSSFSVEQKLLRCLRGDDAKELYELGRENMESLYNTCSWKWNEKKESTE